VALAPPTNFCLEPKIGFLLNYGYQFFWILNFKCMISGLVFEPLKMDFENEKKLISLRRVCEQQRKKNDVVLKRNDWCASEWRLEWRRRWRRAATVARVSFEACVDGRVA